MKKTSGAIASGFLIMFLAAHSMQPQQSVDPQRKQRPSLDETEGWIKQTFTNENTGRSNCGEYDPNQPGVNFGSYTSCTYSAYKISFAACKVTLEVHESTGGFGENGQKPDEYNFKRDSLVSFDLSDIDPNTIKPDAPYGTYGDLKKRTHFDNPPWNVDVHFRTTNDANKIEVDYPFGSDPGKPNGVHTCCDYIGFGLAVRPDYAPRFVKALRNAVELCGGKSSTF